MALEQRKFTSSYIHKHEQEIPETPQRQQEQKRKRKMFSPGEKLLFVIFASFLRFFISAYTKRRPTE